MVWRNKKPEKIDLLVIPDSEKIQVIKEIRRKLQEKIIEEKMLRSLLETETLSVNGNLVYAANAPLKGFSLSTNY